MVWKGEKRMSECEDEAVGGRQERIGAKSQQSFKYERGKAVRGGGRLRRTAVRRTDEAPKRF